MSNQGSLQTYPRIVALCVREGSKGVGGVGLNAIGASPAGQMKCGKMLLE